MAGVIQGILGAKTEKDKLPTDDFSNADQVLHIRGDALSEPNQWAGTSSRPSGQASEQEKRPGDLFGRSGKNTQAALTRALKETKRIETW